MASVRLTRELRESINRRAMDAFDLAKPQPKPSTALTDKVRQAVLDSVPFRTLKAFYDGYTVHGDFKSLNGRPDNLKATDMARLYLSNIGSSGGVHSLHFEFVPPIRVYTSSNWGTLTFYFDEFNLEDRAALQGPLLDLCGEINQNQSDRQNYADKIGALLSECTTIKQLLMVWPAGESFVPHEYMTKMYEKVTRIERAQRIKKEVEFDDSFVNEVVLTAKLVGG